jgi:uncharacterized damage-inducible protein DinB
MDQQTLTRTWDRMRLSNGIGLRVIAQLPEDQLDSHPIPNMRTPKQLVVHVYGMSLKGLVVGALAGRLEDLDEPAAVATIRTKGDLLRYCRECWDAADRAIAAFTDEKLRATVATPWGTPLTGSRCITAAEEEYLHHRGQLYAYVRALGQEPPDMYDFKNNAPEFQPRQKQAT